MPYVERTVVAGAIRETKKMYTGRIHTENVKRQPNRGDTSDAQRKANERKAEEQLRWKLNANFGAGDFHVTLHYYDKPQDLEKAEADKRAFLRLLRKICQKLGIEWKYVACTENRYMSNIHHHIILPAISINILFEVWEKVVGRNKGNVSVKPLDRRGNHAKMARYLMKESRTTAERYREMGKRYKRFSCAQGMVTPEPQYRVVEAAKWAKEPKHRKNYILLKDDNGATVRSGVHEVSGWPWQEYFELWTGKGSPPGAAGRTVKRRRIMKS